MADKSATIRTIAAKWPDPGQMDGTGKVLYYLTTWTILIIMLAFIFMMASGDRYKDTLEEWGFYHSKAGLYSSCSNAKASKGNKFCEPVKSPSRVKADKTWKEVDNNMPFSLGN